MRKSPEERPSQYVLDERACRMICPIAAAMVGVCLTAIGILRVVIAVRRANTLADDLLALDAVLFLIATLTSYFALRTVTTKRMHDLERVADVTFIAAMLLMTVAALVMTYALAV
ncbi:hypothetical protein JMG10_31685 [Nostoc ellipsosporum NOK]|uniref:hypothetical protein n=1 Tax=Sphingomonas sp. IBVSS2 TaxID=1985172 RepID=UPI000A2E15B1|nr:hypothetical protein [Sphingomonas sp. IBVSS2]MDF2386071.1 hypothetical protein [Nostoc ellipsosporum NOK]OSZ64411.1 hypothetical protein CAP40_17330 [Sphingomonas sp. IBVSS2]